ncbi:MAG: ATP synthase F1 subunit gamma [Planctomycetota bacterium]
MAKPRAILKRRKAVQNIAKITKTMQMIATARFKKAFDRAVAARPYTDRLAALVARLASAAGELKHPLLDARPDGKRIAIVAIASNRGLCGGYNSGIVRQTLGARRAAAEAGKSVRLLVAGRKLGSALKFQGLPTEVVWTHFEDKPSFAQVNEAVGPLIEAYAKGELDEVSIAYTKFESASRQRAVVERILPFSVEALASSAKAGAQGAEPTDWIFDPDATTILTDLIPRTVRLRAFQAFLDAAVSEQVARMTAMKAATDNANDMIKSLGRQFNRSRQSQITTELTEIMGGAAALE